MSVATAQPATTARGRLPVPSRDLRPARAARATLLVTGHDIGPGDKVTADESSSSRVPWPLPGVVAVLIFRLSFAWTPRRLQPRGYRDWCDRGRNHAGYPPLVVRAPRRRSSR
jgi:hypothetical protein